MLVADLMWDRVKVAAVQYPVTGGLSFQQFLEKVGNFATAAAEARADLVVFPELFAADLFQKEKERDAIERIVLEDTPRFFESIQEMSRARGISILAGTIPRRAEEGIRNTAFLAFADGRAPILQDKAYLTHCEKEDWQWIPGTSGLQVFDAPWGKTVISICYDTEIPVLSHELAALAPEVILVPSCTAAIHGFHRVRWTAQARAIEHYAYVVHTGTIGPGTRTPNMNRQYGQAAIITPSDDGFPGMLAEGPLNLPSIVYGELDLGLLRKSRLKTTIYPARDQMRRLGGELK